MIIQKILEQSPSINVTDIASDLFAFGQSTVTQTAKIIFENYEEKLHSREAVMHKLDICSATPWRWDKLKLINGKKIGNRKYYPESEIKRLSREEGGSK